MKLIQLIIIAPVVLAYSISNAEQGVQLKLKPGKAVSKPIDHDDGLINADFPEPTDIRDIAKAFSLWLNKPFEVDESAYTKVKLISPERITKQEAEKRFLRMLKTYGLKTVETDSKILIVKVQKDCGPVPPGGTMDQDCNRGIAPPPSG